MHPYNKSNKVSDIEHPTASNIYGRDILGLNINLPNIIKIPLNYETDKPDIEFLNKRK